MTPSFDAEFPVDRWAVRLDEPTATTAAYASGTDSDDADAALSFAFTLDVPATDFQPRLSRFGEAA